MGDCGKTLGIDIGGTSIKGALLDGVREVWTGRSGQYARPDRATLEHALAELIGASPAAAASGVTNIGVCAPGLRDEQGLITKAVNVPGLVGIAPRALIAAAAPALATVRVTECTDSHAAAADFWRARKARGRLLAISLGTGVGACVLDANRHGEHGEHGEPVPLIVTGRGPGQIGQMDVGEVEWERTDISGEHASHASAGRHMPLPMPLGPDGGRGTLEAYMGLPALRSRFGDDLSGAIASGAMRADRPPLSALVRALRIAHAIYLPERIVLLGGVGIRLRPLLGEMRDRISDGLTTLARPDWTLEAGESDFHAARGAAWMAGQTAIGR